ncbi:MAG: hypothetical protein HBSAPP02_02280 [Phycisphaerae bacterium]|nr:MAG: MotA/TolQ/ExbB proton channel family protein [Planctomycetia bacterium]GJQ25196.1 MAG: hypothetical protein HBSAPP02_02280 [Phycisphaerae bacterium]
MRTASAQSASDLPRETDPSATRPQATGACAATAAAGILGFLFLWGHAFFRTGFAPQASTFVSGYAAALIVGSPIVILLAVYGPAGILDAFAWIVRSPRANDPRANEQRAYEPRANEPRASARAAVQSCENDSLEIATPHGTNPAAPWRERDPFPRQDIDSTAAEEAVVFFQVAAALCLAFGFIATVVGLIVSLANLRNPSQLGPGVAAALLSQMYGVCIAVTCLALATFIARRHAAMGAMKPLARRAATAGGLTLIAGSLTTLIAFGIMMISMRPVI